MDLSSRSSSMSTHPPPSLTNLHQQYGGIPQYTHVEQHHTLPPLHSQQHPHQHQHQHQQQPPPPHEIQPYSAAAAFGYLPAYPHVVPATFATSAGPAGSATASPAVPAYAVPVTSGANYHDRSQAQFPHQAHLPLSSPQAQHQQQDDPTGSGAGGSHYPNLAPKDPVSQAAELDGAESDSTTQNSTQNGRTNSNGKNLHVVGSQGRRGILPSIPSRSSSGSAGLVIGANGKTQIPVKDADGKFPCPNCNKTYLHSKHLKRHLLRHTGDRPYMCVLCKDTFSRSDILKRHFHKCSIRRGNPSGIGHLSHPHAHRKNAQAAGILPNDMVPPLPSTKRALQDQQQLQIQTQQQQQQQLAAFQAQHPTVMNGIPILMGVPNGAPHPHPGAMGLPPPRYIDPSTGYPHQPPSHPHPLTPYHVYQQAQALNTPQSQGSHQSPQQPQPPMDHKEANTESHEARQENYPSPASSDSNGTTPNPDATGTPTLLHIQLQQSQNQQPQVVKHEPGQMPTTAPLPSPPQLSPSGKHEETFNDDENKQVSSMETDHGKASPMGRRDGSQQETVAAETQE